MVNSIINSELKFIPGNLYNICCYSMHFYTTLHVKHVYKDPTLYRNNIIIFLYPEIREVGNKPALFLYFLYGSQILYQLAFNENEYKKLEQYIEKIS